MKKKSPSDGQIFTRGIEGILSFGEMEENAPRDQKQQSRLGWISLYNRMQNTIQLDNCS